MARQTSEINASSMADIAFLLLIFFLVTTTMDIDSGITRMLPPWLDETEPPPPIKERNVFVVLLNMNNQLLVEGELMDVRQLAQKTKDFIDNPTGNEDLSQGETVMQKLQDAQSSEKTEVEKSMNELVSEFGTAACSRIRISKGVVSLRNDRSTEYGIYIEVQNEIVKAFNELKDDFSRNYYQKAYDDLTEDQQRIVRKIYPLSISEAEPRNIGD